MSLWWQTTNGLFENGVYCELRLHCSHVNLHDTTVDALTRRRVTKITGDWLNGGVPLHVTVRIGVVFFLIFDAAFQY